MKIEIEISEEDAACIWENRHGPRNKTPLRQLLADALQEEAENFKRNFPKAVSRVVSEFQHRITP